MALLADTGRAEAGLSRAHGRLKFDNRRKDELRRRLDFVAVAETHVLWKARMGHHIDGTIRESLDGAPLGQDGICQLGNWISSCILEPLCEPEVCRQLSEAHRQFHESGALIIERLRASDRRGAAEIFGNEYSWALRCIIHALTEINKQLQADE